jgi:DNA helicase IV
MIARDQQQFSTIERSIDSTIAELTTTLDAERRAPARHGQQALDRDLQVHRISQRLRALSRYGIDLCLGRMVLEGETEPVYVGRFGLTDRDGTRLLLDWRSPAAEPFFGATHAHPMGLESRRRYRWTRGRVTDYWDEVFTADALSQSRALDDHSAFIASLGTSRSPKMRDVLATIQADQDAIIRAGANGALVVDGGPGTGKTVVALHRAAYLIYSDQRIARGGGVLCVGPHRAYLSYIDDVLPSLGEEGVQICTIRDFVPEGRECGEEPDARVADLKSSDLLVAAVEAAVRYYERPPAGGQQVETEWGDIELSVAEWQEAFASADAALPHNEARDQVWEALLDIAADRLTSEHPGSDGVAPHLLRRSLQANEDLMRTFTSAWPLLDPAGVVADLWSVPSYLRLCAPGLSDDDIESLQRADARAWTVADLPLLDAARQRVGDPDASRRRRRRNAIAASERRRMDAVVDELIASLVHDDGEGVMSMLRGEDVRNSLDDDSVLPEAHPDLLAGPFAHIIVDEAQELSDAEWQMLLRRCPSRSFTIVGDRAQARHGFSESWSARLGRVGLRHVEIAHLNINYRTPEEVMTAAEPVIRSVLPEANVPRSIRRSGIPVANGPVSELETVIQSWLGAHDDGVACVISAAGHPPISDAQPVATESARVRSLTPETAKGLEFDLVVLVDPESFGSGVSGAVDRYVAMTRATQQLVILS